MSDDPNATQPWARPDPVAQAPAAQAPAAQAPWTPPPASSAPLPAPGARSRSGGGGLLVNALLGVALVVAVGGVAFAAGRATAPASSAPISSAFGPGGFRNGNGNANGNGGFVGGAFGGSGGGLTVEGTVTAVGADSITLQLAGGQTVTIPIDAKTTYHQRESATAAAVTTGSTVQVQLEPGRLNPGNGNGGGNNGNGNGNGGPNPSGQSGRTLGPASSITLVPAGS